MEVSVRRIADGDGQLLRTMRLAALADAPWAFGASIGVERARSAAGWEARAIANASGCRSASWFASRAEGGDPVGLIAAYHPEPARDVAQLVSMWVAPSTRRLGVGRQLVSIVVDWARTCGDVAVELRVTDSNTAAIGLYERLGFVPTGATEPLGSDPALTTMVLRRLL